MGRSQEPKLQSVIITVQQKIDKIIYCLKATDNARIQFAFAENKYCEEKENYIQFEQLEPNNKQNCNCKSHCPEQAQQSQTFVFSYLPVLDKERKEVSI